MTETVGESIAPGFPTGRLTMTTRTAIPDAATNTVLRRERHPTRFNSPRQAQACTGLARASRFPWNALPADHEARYQLWNANLLSPQPAHSFFTLSKRTLTLPKGTPPSRIPSDTDPGFPQTHSVYCRQYTEKHTAIAYTRSCQVKKAAKAPGETLPHYQTDCYSHTPFHTASPSTGSETTLPFPGNAFAFHQIAKPLGRLLKQSDVWHKVRP